MSIPRVRATEVDVLLSSGRLVASGNYCWSQASKKQWYKVSIPVGVQGRKDINLRVVASVSFKDPARREFVLLWNNVRVRGLCILGSHDNRHTNAEKWLHQTHKHRWTDECHARFAYTPTDITADDAVGQLRQFCAECGIDCRWTLATPTRAEELYEDDL